MACFVFGDLHMGHLAQLLKQSSHSKWPLLNWPLLLMVPKLGSSSAFEDRYFRSKRKGNVLVSTKPLGYSTGWLPETNPLRIQDF